MWEKTDCQQTQTTQEQTEKTWLLSPKSNTTREVMVSLFVAKSIEAFTIRLQLWLFICCKTKLKDIYIYIYIYIYFFFFEKYLCFSQNIHYLQNIFIWKRSFILKSFFAEKNFFYREKYIRKCKNYISHLRNIFLYRKC